MQFTATKLKDATIVDLKKLEDERGFFARAFCQEEFKEAGLIPDAVQANISYNKLKGTLRGMHFQRAPHEETKFIRCTKGAILDVIIDLRPDSETYMQWLGVELTAENYKMLYVPRGFAHGFQTLAPDTEIFYIVSAAYAPQSEGGVRYNDPQFGIEWPLPVSTISDKDANWPDYQKMS